MPFFLARLYKKIMLAVFLFSDIIQCITSAAKRKGIFMAKNHFSFKKRQKELNRLKKKQEKRQRKLDKKSMNTNDMGNPVTDETGDEETSEDEAQTKHTDDDQSSSASDGLRPGKHGNSDMKDNRL